MDLKKNIWIGLLLLGIFSVPTSCSYIKKDNTINGIKVEMDSLVGQLIHEGFMGDVLVAKESKILLQKQYGGYKNVENPGFWIGSLSKQFTATAILKLQEGGELSVGDSISKFIENVPKDKEAITLHHLLSHSSGLPDNYAVDGVTDRDTAINLILESSLRYSIGEKFSYSAEGYNLLAIIVELVSGKSFEDYVSMTLLRPANMEDTGFWGMENKNPVSISAFKDIKLMESFPKTIYKDGKCIPNYGYKGSTGMYSTTKDLFKWVKAIKNNVILQQGNISSLFTPYSSVRGDNHNGTFYGYGWFIQFKNGKIREIRHGGAEDGAIGHNSMIRFYDNGDAIIVLSNAGTYNGDDKFNGVEWSTVVSFGIRDILESENKYYRKAL